MKKLLYHGKAGSIHWVGDGFPVTTLFSFHDIASLISPFLLLDYVQPYTFAPTAQRRGVGVHPHRGIETVTMVFQGEIEHRDSAGGGGLIGPGDVQWMTAASGLLHDERHSTGFAASGGVLELMQLWVNLPAADKMKPPRYQTLLAQTMPEVAIGDGAGRVKILAGSYAGKNGPALCFTPIDIYHISMQKKAQLNFDFAADRSALLILRKGSLTLEGPVSLTSPALAIFSREGEGLACAADAGTEFVILSGARIDEPIVAHGPFVMNTEAEIYEAYRDFQSGKMGGLSIPE